MTQLRSSATWGSAFVRQFPFTTLHVTNEASLDKFPYIISMGRVLSGFVDFGSNLKKFCASVSVYGRISRDF
jgi:hypothetical protein